MDYFHPTKVTDKYGVEKIEPLFRLEPSEYVMTQGKDIYAIWDDKTGLWVTSESLAKTPAKSIETEFYRLTDRYLHEAALKEFGPNDPTHVVSTRTSEALWRKSQNFFRSSGDRFQIFDRRMVYSNEEINRDDYITHVLPYAFEPGEFRAWDEIVGTLYAPEERRKLEWAIGALATNQGMYLQKFFALYGAPGTGKSTIFRIMEKLFSGYTVAFDAAALGDKRESFSTEVFRSNPLVAIQDDGDLSKINDNTLLNSIVSHEPILLKQKYRAPVETNLAALLFVATNSPIRITDANAGILRRLIDIHPTGKRIPPDRYEMLMNQIDFELGAIAYHCAEVFEDMGAAAYNGYVPKTMMEKTNPVYNFIFDNQDVVDVEEGVTLKRLYDLYKAWCEEVGVTFVLRRYEFRDEIMSYFDQYEDRGTIGGERVRCIYYGFKGLDPNEADEDVYDEGTWIELYELDHAREQTIFDETFGGQPAQLGVGPKDNPGKKWVDVTTTLDEMDKSKVHWVRVPENHVIIDFDLKNDADEKDLGMNLEAASKWPPTYVETSQGGQGLHLHYIYSGDTSELAAEYDTGIEVKSLLGNSSLRRRVRYCNDLPFAHISGGLPKKEPKMIDKNYMTSEKSVRDLIARNLRKEVHPGTKPSIDFIHKILEDAYESGMTYDVTDMRPDIMGFAARSTNQSVAAIKVVKDMKFQSEDSIQAAKDAEDTDGPVVFFDIEVYPNLLLICWKAEGSDQINTMINPTPGEVEQLFTMKLVGFNNRRYDNHILYARYLGFDNESIYKVSSGIINNEPDARFAAAYGISYADIYDFSSKKQGLKKFQIELGIDHVEMDLPWDEPCPEEYWEQVIDYCKNDVISTEKVFEARKQDFVARQILASLSGLSTNDTTQKHTAAIVFEGDKNPQSKFIYTDLSEEFEGYSFDQFKNESTYRGEVTGEGGYVYAEPGVHKNVALLDIASMHPTTIEALNLFGDYTKNFSALKEARLAIKHKDYDKARSLLNGKLAPYLDDENEAESLSYALKIVINIVYGLTSARFDNPFRDPRNLDNIVAKRGALFMINLKHELQARGLTVAHVKTDSVKIPNATEEDIQFVHDYGKKYGYDFEHEATYKHFCLVNDAVYIASDGDHWSAVGAQFQHPYVYKTLFTQEPIELEDLCETRNVVKGEMRLAYNGVEEVDDMVHIGRTGAFVPVLHDGASLYRVSPEGKKYAVTGTKGYFWVPSEIAKQRDEHYELFVDMSYFEDLREKAVAAIEQYMPIDEFTNV